MATLGLVSTLRYVAFLSAIPLMLSLLGLFWVLLEDVGEPVISSRVDWLLFPFIQLWAVVRASRLRPITPFFLLLIATFFIPYATMAALGILTLLIVRASTFTWRFATVMLFVALLTGASMTLSGLSRYLGSLIGI